MLKEPLNKSRNTSSCHSGVIPAFAGRNPVKTIIYWMPFFNGMTTKAIFQSFLNQLLLFLTFIILPFFASADEAPPTLCKHYRQDNNESTRNTKPRESIPYGEGLLWKIEAGNGAFA